LLLSLDIIVLYEDYLWYIEKWRNVESI
jgi:hypothetical protein